MVAMVAVGGAGRFWGGILGALMLTVLPELLRSTDQIAGALHLHIDASAVETLIFGLSMILVLLFFPGGLAGGLAALRARLAR
jgi:branched-chain amino acid transport system permease protein